VPILRRGKMINFEHIITNMPGITVIIIDSGRNKEWLKVAQASVLNQIYPLKKDVDGTGRLQIELMVAVNKEKHYKIGQCWNKMIQSAKHNYIFIFDDDDKLAQMILFNLMFYYQVLKLDKKNKDIIGVSPYLTLMEEVDGKMEYTPSTYYTSGLIEKKWLLKIPFNEELDRGVDIQWDEDIIKKKKFVAIQKSNYGYYYRQHDSMVSGRNQDYRLAGRRLNKMVDIEI